MPFQCGLSPQNAFHHVRLLKADSFQAGPARSGEALAVASRGPDRRKTSALKNLAGKSRTDGVGCTLSAGRKVETEIPAKFFQEENHQKWPN
jgi:hypothetical protein